MQSHRPPRSSCLPCTFSHTAADIGDKADGLSQLQITDRPELPPKNTPEIFVSYAWGDDSSADARQRTEVVDRLCETLGQHGWKILRDNNALRSGELISGFMKRIGLADHVIVVFSDKYLRSPYCMTELHYIYQRSLGEKEDFLRRIVPLVLDDARFGTRRDRVEYAKHWEAGFEARSRPRLPRCGRLPALPRHEEMARGCRQHARLHERQTEPAWIRRDREGRFRGLAPDARAAALMLVPPMLPKYVSAAFGSLDQPWKPGYLRSAYGAMCCHRFNPKNMTDDIFLAQSLGHKLPVRTDLSLTVGSTSA